MIENLLMIAMGLLLIYLGIYRKMEPLLLVPIGIGAILVNIPGGGLGEEESIFGYFLKNLIHTEIVPLLIFPGLGALTDFSPLLANPKTFLLGAAAQIGIFAALLSALFLGFTPQEAASIGIIGGLQERFFLATLASLRAVLRRQRRTKSMRTILAWAQFFQQKRRRMLERQ